MPLEYQESETILKEWFKGDYPVHPEILLESPDPDSMLSRLFEAVTVFREAVFWAACK
jgi:hypothetical protein